MKKQHILILLATAAYDYLFYNQLPGLNILIFTSLMLGFLYLVNKEIFFNRNVFVLACGSFISAIAVAYHGGGAALAANLISLSLLTVIAISNSSLITTFFHAVYSYSISFLHIFTPVEKSQNEEVQKPSWMTKTFIMIIPIIVTMIFFVLYRDSNKVFYNFTEKINLDFISISWIGFTIGGALLIYSFFNPQVIVPLMDEEAKLKFIIRKDELRQNNLFNFYIKIENEHLSAFALLLMLNVLLFIVNILDINFLFINSRPMNDVNFSEIVHQGVGTLITSIIFAIGILLIHLRGHLNFHSGNKILRTFAYTWIIQNSILILTTAYKNALYVHDSGFTYKRIGVCIYLFLALIGLLLTLLKIAKLKTSWHLLSANTWAIYIVLVICSLCSWDSFITSWNLNSKHDCNTRADILYLFDLPGDNTISLEKYLQENKIAPAKKEYYIKRLNSKKEYEHKVHQLEDWQSKTFQQMSVY